MKKCNFLNDCRLVPDPVKVLSEIKASGGEIETVEGEVVAGDAGEVPAIRMLGNTLTCKTNFTSMEITFTYQ